MSTADFLLRNIQHIFSSASRKSGCSGGGRRHNWPPHPLHFPCKSASHSQSFHSSSRKHALSQPHSLNADEAIARQLSPPQQWRAEGLVPRGSPAAVKCREPYFFEMTSHVHGKVHGRRPRLLRATTVHQPRNGCSCPCRRKIESKMFICSLIHPLPHSAASPAESPHSASLRLGYLQ